VVARWRRSVVRGRVVRHRPDVSVVDVRMPRPARRRLRAAIEARRRVPGTPVLVLSQYVERQYATELLADGAAASVYLLKDRVATSASSWTRCAGSPVRTALDPEVVSQLMVRRQRDDRLDALTPRERDVLGAMARAGRTWDRGVARHLGGGHREAHQQHLRQAGAADSENDHAACWRWLAYLGHVAEAGSPRGPASVHRVGSRPPATVERLNTTRSPASPRREDPRTAGAVIPDLHHETRASARSGSRSPGGGVLGDVGERFGHHEVGRALHRVREPAPSGSVLWTTVARAASGDRTSARSGHGRAGSRRDPAHQVAQLGERLAA